MKILKTLTLMLAAFIFGLTWHVSYRNAYYEARGYLGIHQMLLGIKFECTWADEGFNKKYPADWNIKRVRDTWPTGSFGYCLDDD